MLKNNRFFLEAYTGSVVDSVFWGKLCVDVAGIRTPVGGTMPALREHDRQKPLGVIDQTKKEINFFTAEGFYLQNADAAEARELIDAKFPMQASVGIWFEEIEILDKEEVARVNGREIQGLDVVVRECFCREISFCTLGLDPETSARNLAASLNMKGSNNMKNLVEKNTLTNFAAAVGKIMRENNFKIEQASKVARAKYPELFEKYQSELLTGNTGEVRFDFEKKEMTIQESPEIFEFNQADLHVDHGNAEIKNFAAAVFEIMRRDGVEIQVASRKAQHKYPDSFSAYNSQLIADSR